MAIVISSRGTAEYLATKLVGHDNACIHFPKVKPKLDKIPHRLGFFSSSTKDLSILETRKLCVDCFHDAVPQGQYNYWLEMRADQLELYDLDQHDGKEDAVLRNLKCWFLATRKDQGQITSSEKSASGMPRMLKAGSEGYVIGSKARLETIEHNQYMVSQLDHKAWRFMQTDARPFYISAIHSAAPYDYIEAKKAAIDAVIAIQGGVDVKLSLQLKTSAGAAIEPSTKSPPLELASGVESEEQTSPSTTSMSAISSVKLRKARPARQVSNLNIKKVDIHSPGILSSHAPPSLDLVTISHHDSSRASNTTSGRSQVSSHRSNSETFSDATHSPSTPLNIHKGRTAKAVRQKNRPANLSRKSGSSKGEQDHQPQMSTSSPHDSPQQDNLKPNLQSRIVQSPTQINNRDSFSSPRPPSVHIGSEASYSPRPLSSSIQEESNDSHTSEDEESQVGMSVVPISSPRMSRRRTSQGSTVPLKSFKIITPQNETSRLDSKTTSPHEDVSGSSMPTSKVAVSKLRRVSYADETKPRSKTSSLVKSEPTTPQSAPSKTMKSPVSDSNTPKGPTLAMSTNLRKHSDHKQERKPPVTSSTATPPIATQPQSKPASPSLPPPLIGSSPIISLHHNKIQSTPPHKPPSQKRVTSLPAIPQVSKSRPVSLLKAQRKTIRSTKPSQSPNAIGKSSVLTKVESLHTGTDAISANRGKRPSSKSKTHSNPTHPSGTNDTLSGIVSEAKKIKKEADQVVEVVKTSGKIVDDVKKIAPVVGVASVAAVESLDYIGNWMKKVESHAGNGTLGLDFSSWEQDAEHEAETLKAGVDNRSHHEKHKHGNDTDTVAGAMHTYRDTLVSDMEGRIANAKTDIKQDLGHVMSKVKSETRQHEKKKKKHDRKGLLGTGGVGAGLGISMLSGITDVGTGLDAAENIVKNDIVDVLDDADGALSKAENYVEQSLDDMGQGVQEVGDELGDALQDIAGDVGEASQISDSDNNDSTGDTEGANALVAGSDNDDVTGDAGDDGDVDGASQLPDSDNDNNPDDAGTDTGNDPAGIDEDASQDLEHDTASEPTDLGIEGDHDDTESEDQDDGQQSDANDSTALSEQNEDDGDDPGVAPESQTNTGSDARLSDQEETEGEQEEIEGEQEEIESEQDEIEDEQAEIEGEDTEQDEGASNNDGDGESSQDDRDGESHDDGADDTNESGGEDTDDNDR